MCAFCNPVPFHSVELLVCILCAAVQTLGEHFGCSSIIIDTKNLSTYIDDKTTFIRFMVAKCRSTFTLPPLISVPPCNILFQTMRLPPRFTIINTRQQFNVFTLVCFYQTNLYYQQTNHMLLLSHVNIFYVINTRKYATNINMYRVGQRNEWMNKRRMEYMKTFQYDCKQGVTDFVQTSN